MKKVLLASFVTISIALSAQAQTRYIAPAGVDSIGDCTDPLNPCASISYAVSQAIAADTIMVDTGTYAFTNAQIVNKSVIITGANNVNKPIITVADQDVIQVTADSVTVNGLRIEMGLTPIAGFRGIVASGNYNGLVLSNNDIISTKVYAAGLVFGSYGILASGGNGQLITLTGNTIHPLDSAYDSHGRGLGIGLNGTPGPGGSISNNDFRAYYPIQSIGNTADLAIDSNNFVGNVLMTYCGAGTSVMFSNNAFDGFNIQIASNLSSLLEIRAINNASVLVQGNQFINYKNIALLSSASRSITVVGNEFTPLATSNTFVSIMANSKLQTNGTQNTTYSNQIDIRGNIFNANDSLHGTAITFGDHYGVTIPAFQDSMIVGGYNAYDKNVFDTNHKYYIALDTLSGPSTAFNLWAPYPATTMMPFTQSIYAIADFNEYNITDTLLLEEKMLDSLDFSGIGKVILFDPLVTSINNQKVADFTVFPNPATNFISLPSASFKGIVKVSMIDITGKNVQDATYEVQQNAIKISTENIPAGLYLLSIQNQGKLYYSKFIKQ